MPVEPRPPAAGVLIVPRRTLRVDSIKAWAVTWGPVVAISAAIFLLSSRPKFGELHALAEFLDALFGGRAWYVRAAPVVEVLDAASSWVAHFTEFGLLALAWLWALRQSGVAAKRALWLAWACSVLFALSDELHQHFVPGRHSTWQDVATDAAGAAFALAVIAFVHKSRPVFT